MQSEKILSGRMLVLLSLYYLCSAFERYYVYSMFDCAKKKKWTKFPLQLKTEQSLTQVFHKLFKWSYSWLKETEKSISQFGTLQLHSKSARRENWIKLRQADSTPWKMNLTSCFWNMYLPCAIRGFSVEEKRDRTSQQPLLSEEKVCFPGIKRACLGIH